MRKKPTVVALHLDNPLVIPEIAKEAGALLATFGVSDEALFDVLFGRFAPTGRLPFEMPSSMDAVRAQLEDVPHDSKSPALRDRVRADVPEGPLRSDALRVTSARPQPLYSFLLSSSVTCRGAPESARCSSSSSLAPSRSGSVTWPPRAALLSMPIMTSKPA